MTQGPEKTLPEDELGVYSDLVCKLVRTLNDKWKVVEDDLQRRS